MIGVEALRPAGLRREHLEDIAAWFDRGAGFQVYDVRKRRGGTRTVYEASLEFSSVLKMLRRALEQSGVYHAPDFVHGYVKGRSIVTNATPHLGRTVVLCVDIADFFPSISRELIERKLSAAGCDSEFASLIARATTIEGRLPPGLSTSPFLANVVFRDTDTKLDSLAKELDLTYTRFADDLCFSGDFADEALDAIRIELAESGWDLNEDKTRFMRRGGPQYVTGLYVGSTDRPRVPRHIKRRVRQRIHYLSLHGFLNVFERRNDEAMFENEAWGWVRYIAQTEPVVARRLGSLLEHVDFDDEYLYWSDPDDWDGLLDEIGM